MAGADSAMGFRHPQWTNGLVCECGERDNRHGDQNAVILYSLDEFYLVESYICRCNLITCQCLSAR